MATRRVQGYRSRSAQDAGLEADGAYMSLAHGTQAEYEADVAGLEAGLIRMENHRRVEQSRCFEAVFVTEIGTDQQATIFSGLAAYRKILANFREPLGECLRQRL